MAPYFTDNTVLHLLSSFTFTNLCNNKHMFSLTSQASSQLMLTKSAPNFILRNGLTNCPKHLKINKVPPFVKALQLLTHCVLSKMWAIVRSL